MHPKKLQILYLQILERNKAQLTAQISNESMNPVQSKRIDTNTSAAMLQTLLRCKFFAKQEQ